MYIFESIKLKCFLPMAYVIGIENNNNIKLYKIKNENIYEQ